MFNKIVASVISSVVLFACSVKDSSSDGDVTSAVDVVSSAPTPAPEAVKTQDLPTVTPVTTPTVTSPDQNTNPVSTEGTVNGGASPSVTPSPNANVTSTASPGSMATSTTPMDAPSAAPTVTSPAATSTVK